MCAAVTTSLNRAPASPFVHLCRSHPRCFSRWPVYRKPVRSGDLPASRQRLSRGAGCEGHGSISPAVPLREGTHLPCLQHIHRCPPARRSSPSFRLLVPTASPSPGTGVAGAGGSWSLSPGGARARQASTAARRLRSDSRTASSDMHNLTENIVFQTPS